MLLPLITLRLILSLFGKREEGGLENDGESIIELIFTDPCLADDLVGSGWAVLGVQVSEVGALAVVIDHIGEVNGVSDEAGAVHEVVGDFQTSEQGDLGKGRSTMSGARRLRLSV